MSVEPGPYRNEMLWIARILSIFVVLGFGFYLGQAWAQRPVPCAEAAP